MTQQVLLHPPTPFHDSSSPSQVMLAEKLMFTAQSDAFWIQPSVFSSKLEPDGNGREQNGIQFCSVACGVNKTLRFFYCCFGKKMAGNPRGPIALMCIFLPVLWAVCTHWDVLLYFHQSGRLQYEHITQIFFFPRKRIKKQYIHTEKYFLCSSALLIRKQNAFCSMK